MKTFAAAVAAAALLAGCVAVPVPYQDGYYAAPAMTVGVYSGPYWGHRHHYHHSRHRHHYHRH